MPTVNMHDAKSGLSKLVADLESGAETEIIIARNGKPVARLVPMEAAELEPRPIGFADGEFETTGVEWLDDESVQLENTIEARWDRFERHSRDLKDRSAKARKKTA